jgi:hypothetical protein
MVTLPFSLTICFSTLLAHEFYKKKEKGKLPNTFSSKKNGLSFGVQMQPNFWLRFCCAIVLLQSFIFDPSYITILTDCYICLVRVKIKKKVCFTYQIGTNSKFVLHVTFPVLITYSDVQRKCSGKKWTTQMGRSKKSTGLL